MEIIRKQIKTGELRKKKMSHKVYFVLDKIHLSSWMIWPPVFNQTDEKKCLVE